jgi:branched-chain amino acid transport system permease protein
MEFFTISMLNGLSYGLLLFMLSSGLTLIFSMMGVLNFAHASFYMLGAYIAYTIARLVGFWPALVLAPLWSACSARCSSAVRCAACTSSAMCPSC